LGIVLIYLAILQQPIIGSSREVVFARLIPCGIALALFGFLADLTALPLTLESWFVVWIGVFVSIVAFWAVLYPYNLAPTDG
jgi:ABC-type lipoprotein release transport system permease subunit